MKKSFLGKFSVYLLFCCLSVIHVQAQEPDFNHCVKGSGDLEYCILRHNCHTAANAGVEEKPGTTGIIICGGKPDEGEQGHHTFNYRIRCQFDLIKCPGEPDQKRYHSCWTRFYNWGSHCDGDPVDGTPGTDSMQTSGEIMEQDLTPSICEADSKNRACVKKFCGKQWDDCKDERPLPPGTKVEEPGPQSCKELHGEGGVGSDCYLCCSGRAANFTSSDIDVRPPGWLVDWFSDACENICEGESPYCDKKNRRPKESCAMCCLRKYETIASVNECKKSSKCDGEQPGSF